MDRINMFLIGTIVIFILVIIFLWFYTIWEPCIDRGIDSCIVLPDDISLQHSDLLASPGMLKTFSWGIFETHYFNMISNYFHFVTIH